MKVLLVEPMRHPREIDITPSLEEYYRILDCRCITAVYPWEEPLALVTDDEGFFTDKLFSRYIPEMGQPICGSFFLCGLGEENFADLPPELMKKFKEKFWNIQTFIHTKCGLLTVEEVDGTQPQ